MLGPFVLLAVAAGLAGGPYDLPPYPPAGSTVFGSTPHPGEAATDFNFPAAKAVAFEYEAKAKALQSEMVALQESDGGKLTRTHRDYLRAKADALVAAFQRDIQFVAAVERKR